MGAVQKLATVVIVGLVALATLLVVVLANESHRRSAEAKTQQEISIQRGVDLFVKYCVTCHGPAGEGIAMGEAARGRIGASLGGHTFATRLNQEGINAEGTPYPGGVEARGEYLTNAITNGLNCNPQGTTNCQMPAWGASGQLNPDQINDLVTMIQHVDWNYVYNTAIKTDGGYPTPPGAPAPKSTAAPSAATQAPAASGGATAKAEVEMVDIAFKPKDFTIPANTPVELTIKNTGALPHDFSITDHKNPNVKNLNISVTLNPGESKTITVDAPAGSYYFYCNQPGHEAAGMYGTMTVK